jgi:hypothetical protein
MKIKVLANQNIMILVIVSGYVGFLNQTDKILVNHVIIQNLGELQQQIEQSLLNNLFGKIRSTSNDSAPGIALFPLKDASTALLLFRSLSLDKKFSFVAIRLGAMPNSPRS